MSEPTRAFSDVVSDIDTLLGGGGVASVFVGTDDYDLLMAAAPLVTGRAITDAFDVLVPTVRGCPVEWREFYHGAPTAVEPTRRRVKE